MVVPRPGARSRPGRRCGGTAAARLPRHAVPRFVSVETSLPRNGSLKIVRARAARPRPPARRLGRRGVHDLARRTRDHHALRVLDLTDAARPSRPPACSSASARTSCGSQLESEPPRPAGRAALARRQAAGVGARRRAVDAAVGGPGRATPTSCSSPGPCAGCVRSPSARPTPTPGRTSSHVVVTPFGLTGPAPRLARRRPRADRGRRHGVARRRSRARRPSRRRASRASSSPGRTPRSAHCWPCIARRRTGAGQLVEVSAQEAVAATLETGAIAWIHGRHRCPDARRASTATSPTGSSAAADGYLAGGYSGSPRMWDDLLAWMVEEGEAEDLADERWQDVDVPLGAAGRTSTRSWRASWLAAPPPTVRRGGPAPRHCPGPRSRPRAALLDNPQLRAPPVLRRHRRARGRLRDVGFALRVTGRPHARSASPAPAAPVDAARRSWQPSPSPQAHRPPTAAAAARPRCGARRRPRARPDLGARRARTSPRPSPSTAPTSSRSSRPTARTRPASRPACGCVPRRGFDDSGYFLNFNRNKRSLALNLRTDAGPGPAAPAGAARRRRGRELQPRRAGQVGPGLRPSCASSTRTSSWSRWPASARTGRGATP